ncbi:histone-lysine N-methyltransferase ATXR3 [Selaginella moellendorffii]|uniref:histone-lysine N-methyltransferase ATXR3 n=1 Tax=Selaginella moellendorffii TaxID=88036 RepID=UPI000D1CE491|nr:histone-lysine N-methyltransferase ATXR3 [Selaginella moellendorffii]|eukprot:XP_024523733.1 histone-lysine N-methyltransferase ATXR3 [Selaginella moellendorffii]
MGEVLPSLSRDLVHQYEIEEEEVTMVSSPDRPPGSPGAPLDLNFQNANQVDEPTLSLDAREHQEEFSRGSGMDSHLGESNHFSRSDRELENALPLHQDKEDKGRGGRKTRWDPSPTKQGAQSESGNDLAYGQDNDLDERHTIGSRRASMISSSSSYGNGYADHDSRSRRYNDSRRCVTIQGNIRKDNYYRNDVKPSLEYKSSSYERSAVYDRGPHRFGTRNGFERRGDWCASRGSRDHRDWGNRSESRESYDARDRRCDREVFERRDWIRGAERDRRQVRSSEEWHSDDYRSSSGQWDSSSRFTSVQAAVPAFQANEGSAFLSSSHHLPPPSVEHESSTPPPPVAALQPVLGDPGTHVAMEIESDGQEQEDRDETYEPGEVKDGWVYINKNGDTQGPMELAALKLLASREFMPDDHLVMRCGTNAWITLEHAQSPDNGSSALQRLVNPVAATRNAKDATLAESTIDGNEQFQNESFEFLDIDGRVERILATCRASDQGNELKSVLSALDAQRQHSPDEGSAAPELSNPWKDSYNLGFGVDTDLECLDAVSRVVPPEPVPAPPPSTEEDLHHHDHNPSPLKWKPGRWTSKGGDWKLLHPDGQNYVKVVLNEGSLLCERSHYGVDPRRQVQVSERPKFELPQWALDRSQKADSSAETTKSASATRPAKTATRAFDHGKEIAPERASMERPSSFLTKKASFSDTRPKTLPPERHTPSARTFSWKAQRPSSCSADIKAKCNHDLGRGDWFYKDGGGRERGPYSFAELQAMVGRELLIPGTSAYRKSDDLWVPLPRPEMDDGNFNVTEVTTSSFDGARRVRKVVTTNIQQTIMAFTSGQLHEHVMKHYKNQVMSAILFEGLDARAKLIESNRRLSTCSTVALLSGEDSWIGYGRSHPSPSSSNDTSDEREDGDQDHRPNRRPLFRSNGLSQEQTSRKRRLVYNDDVESSEDELPTGRRTRQRRLIRNDVFDSSDEHLYEAGQNNSWETLGQLMLMRIYHHLKGDLKSLALISMTCKSWRAAVEKFKPKVKCLDFTSIGVHCTDAVLSSVQQQNYGGGNLKQILLKDCTVLSPDALGKFLEACPTIQDVDINGCDQFGDLSHSFPQVNWVYDDSEVSDSATQGSDDSHRKMKSLNSIGTCSLSKDDEDVDESEPMDIDPCYSNEQDIDSMTQHSGYKRVKVTTDIKVLKDNGYLKGKRKTTVTKKLNKLRRSVKSVVLDEEFTEVDEYACDVREWGARMTKAAMVPPVTRKYEIIEDYWIVIDKDLVERKMQVEVPDDYEEKLRASKLKRGEYSHLDIPDIKNYHPRRELGVEVMEQEVYGIDPYTHNLLLDTMPKIPAMTLQEKLQFMEETLLQAINKEVKQFTGTGKAPIDFSLEPVIQRIVDDAQDTSMQQFAQGLLSNMRNRTKEKYLAYRKGLGVVCNKDGGFKEDDFVVEFFGEVYPAWRWYEKQDGCRYLQKKDKEPLPEFYNILLERPKGDAAGYDLVVVDAMHKANFASRICHSCRPNCEAKVTAVKGRYIIGVYALRPIQNGEELTFDYNSVTESKEEYNNSICLCGSQCCRGSYLNLANAGASQDVIKERHGLLDRHVLLLEACCEGPVTRLELEEMRQAGVGSCLLDGLPDWLLKYTARLVEFMNLERQLLPDELMRSVKKKRKDADLSYELGRVDAENQAEGVYNQRLQNIAITLDKVRYVLRQLFTDPREAPPLLKKLDQKELVSRLWSAENSIVNELLSCMMPHIPADRLAELKRQVQEHTPDERDDGGSLRESLLWLRDTLRGLEPTVLSRHDAAADLVQMYAYTQCFFTCEEYGTFESPPIEISSLDLGKHVNPPSCHKWKKTYNKEYVLGQLISWFKQTCADPGASLVQQRRGCLVLPDFSSCYAKGLQQDSRRAYGSRFREEMFPRMERWPQKQWPKSQFWEFKSNRGLFGSPMLDAVQRRGYPDSEMMHWLKTRPVNFEGPYDD